MQHSISCNGVSKHSLFDRVGWGGIPLKPKCFSLGSRHQLDPAVARRLIGVLKRGAQSQPLPAAMAPEPPAEALTDRERDVLRLIAQGATNREIAAQLVISEGTVKNHVSNILNRLGLRDRTQAALYARDQHLI
jgi:DNA-binding NarL/FixJ family response regulator